MARKKGGGGKLNRSEIIQARLDPKIHMAAEIMARSERRTLSSFIERSTEVAAKTYKVRRNLFFPWWSEDPELFCANKIYSKFDHVTVEKAAQDISADHEAIRFFKFAIYFPDLLNKNEEEIFNNIIFTKYFWMHYPVFTEDQNGNQTNKHWVQVDAFEGLIHANLFEYWERIKLNQISFELLQELPIGKKIPEPLKEDPRAIKKYIRTGDQSKPFKTIFAWINEETIAISKEDSFWKKNSKQLVPKKIEIKHTEEGPQIVITHALPMNQKEWAEFYQNKKEEMTNGN